MTSSIVVAISSLFQNLTMWESYAGTLKHFRYREAALGVPVTFHTPGSCRGGTPTPGSARTGAAPYFRAAGPLQLLRTASVKTRNDMQILQRYRAGYAN